MPTASCRPSGRHAMQWIVWLVGIAKRRCHVTRYTETCESDVAIAMRSIVGHHSMATTSPLRPFGNPVSTSNAAGIATQALASAASRQAWRGAKFSRSFVFGARDGPAAHRPPVLQATGTSGATNNTPQHHTKHQAKYNSPKPGASANEPTTLSSQQKGTQKGHPLQNTPHPNKPQAHAPRATAIRTKRQAHEQIPLGKIQCGPPNRGSHPTARSTPNARAPRRHLGRRPYRPRVPCERVEVSAAQSTSICI
jgi:hypothetical protein